MKKRIASLFLTVLLACTMVLSMTVTASAATHLNEYLKPVSKTKVPWSISKNMQYNGVTYFRFSITVNEWNGKTKGNCIYDLKCLETPDPDDVWGIYFESGDGTFQKWIAVDQFKFLQKDTRDVWQTKLPGEIPTGPCKLCFVRNDEILDTIDFVAEERHLWNNSERTYICIDDETIAYGEDLHISGVLRGDLKDYFAPIKGNIDLTLSDGSVHTIDLVEISDYGHGILGDFNFTISGLDPGEYSITSAKFYGSDCYADAEIPFSGTCVVEGNGLGSILSEGYPEIVFGVGGLAVGFFAGMLIFRKKKTVVSSASADDEE